MAAGNDEESSEILSSLVDTLQLCGSKVKEGSLRQVLEDLETHFSLQDFWLKFGMTFRAVSKEATKLAAMYSKPPIPNPEELQGVLTGFETSIIAMLTVFLSLPASQGKALHKRIQTTVSAIVEGSKILVQSLMKHNDNSNQAINQSAGALWERCDSFHSFPLDNKYAVLDVFKMVSELVKDALSEVEQAQTNNGRENTNSPSQTDGTNEQGWSSHDAQLVAPCVGVVKACRSCLKKVSGAIRTYGKATSHQLVQELDSMEEILQKISPSVDDLVSSLYAPMNHTTVANKGFHTHT
ncbi:cyclin-D1-binding protein 1 homolog isoform X2 [Nematostella vectensis]|uniref:cyclin-D1-binding protein 1 homolog isoform X2 n=1 Tax=Nematostella vectensis TaxID=45351 RepID=UPI002076FE15|nr:cyclin-D1-binding protein 1 homolog isoform X2 [Nematostella vectensis]